MRFVITEELYNELADRYCIEKSTSHRTEKVRKLVQVQKKKGGYYQAYRWVKIAEEKLNENKEYYNHYEKILNNHILQIGKNQIQLNKNRDLKNIYKKINTVVANVKPNTIKKEIALGNTIRNARKWLTLSGFKVFHTEIGDVEIIPGNINNSFSHSKPVTQERVDALTSIKEVLENGVCIGSARDFDGKTITNYYFAAKINYGDKQKIVFCRVKHPDGSVKRFYVDEVFTEDEIKKRDLPSSVSGNQDIRSKSLYRIILQDIYGVNNYLKNKEYFINKSNFGGN